MVLRMLSLVFIAVAFIGCGDQTKDEEPDAPKPSQEECTRVNGAVSVGVSWHCPPRPCDRVPVPQPPPPPPHWPQPDTPHGPTTNPWPYPPQNPWPNQPPPPPPPYRGDVTLCRCMRVTTPGHFYINYCRRSESGRVGRHGVVCWASGGI